MKWVKTGGQDTLNSQTREVKIKRESSRVSQIVLQSTKTKRQVQCNNERVLDFYQKKQTPSNVGLALYIHKETRSKELIVILSQLILSINFAKVLQIKAAICNAVDNKIYENGGIFAPLRVENDCPLYFANDNCDFKINKSDGKIEFHGTITTVYQAAKKDCDTRSLKINLIEKDRSLKMHH